MVAIKRHHFYPWVAPGEYHQCRSSSCSECAKQELSQSQTGAIRTSLWSPPPLPVTKSLAWNSEHYSQMMTQGLQQSPLVFSTVLICVFLDFCIGRAPWSIWHSLLHVFLFYSPSEETCHFLKAGVATARETALPSCISKALRIEDPRRDIGKQKPIIITYIGTSSASHRWYLLSPEYLWGSEHLHLHSQSRNREWCKREGVLR